MKNKLFPPIHPGEILLEDFLKPMGISQYRLATDIGVPPRRINEIVQGKRAITPDTALRLAAFFDMSAEFWLGLQGGYELERLRDQRGLAGGRADIPMVDDALLVPDTSSAGVHGEPSVR
jgi:antitoxin HigA-1